MSTDAGTAPEIPDEYKVYDSYATDPIYQLYFTYAWVGAIGLGVLIGLPGWVRRRRRGGWRGVWLGWREWVGGIEERMDMGGHGDSARLLNGTQTKTTSRNHAGSRRAVSSSLQRLRIRLISIFSTLLYPSLPLYLPTISFSSPSLTTSNSSRSRPSFKWTKTYSTISIGQALVLGVYTAVVLICLFRDAELSSSGNRPGFLALTQLTPIFLCSLPTSPLLYLLPPLPPSSRSRSRHLLNPSSPYSSSPLTHPSHLTLNPIHRHLSRLLFLLTTLHGALWIAQFRTYKEDDQLRTDKVIRGLTAWAFLLAVVASSLGMVRRRWYGFFWIMHLLCIIGFFAAVSYHTPYSRPWIWPPIALFAWDLAVRAVRLRVKEGVILALCGGEEKGEGWTMIHIPDCDSGWRPTQHLNLRILHGGGSGSSMFASHPFTITNGPVSSTLSALDSTRGLTLYAKAVGSWTRGLHRGAKEGDFGYVSSGPKESFEEDEYELKEPEGGGTAPSEGARVTVLIDGPYGGLQLDLNDYADVVVLAGGSGITFAIACVEECFAKVGACARGGGEDVVQRVKIVWMVRDMGSVEALGPTLAHLHHRAQQVSGLELNIDIHFTRRSDVTVEPDLPPTLRDTSTTLSSSRPDLSGLIKEMASAQSAGQIGREYAGRGETGGGLAVIACGPRDLVTESRNAVAGLSVDCRMRCGGVDFHGEGYST